MLKIILAAIVLSVSNFAAVAKPIAADENSISPLLNGHTIPNVTLNDVQGNPVNLQKLVAAKPTVFFFYRGGWCPFCNIQMGQLKEIEPKLIEMGFQLVGVSPDSPAKLRESMTDNKLDYLLLSDDNLAASKAFGLAFFTSQKVTDMYQAKLKVNNTLRTMSNGEQRLVLPVPAIYIADKEGLIHFQYANPNYKVRPASELIMTAASLVINQ